MKEEFRQYTLATKVLAVVVINRKEDGEIFDWSAYIDAVKGHNHNNEWQRVCSMGDKLPLEIAKVLFLDLPIDNFRW